MLECPELTERERDKWCDSRERRKAHSDPSAGRPSGFWFSFRIVCNRLIQQTMRPSDFSLALIRKCSHNAP